MEFLLDIILQKNECIDKLIHLGGCLYDFWLYDVDSGFVRKLFGAKNAGEWYFYKHNTKDEIRHSVMYSSITTAFANISQTNNLVSNSCMNGLKCLWNGMNLQGVSIQWPEITDVGMTVVKDVSVSMWRNDILRIVSVMNTLKKMLSPDGVVDEEMVNSSLPLSRLQEDHFLLRLQPFLCKVVFMVSQGIIKRSKALKLNDMGKICNIEEF